MRIALFTPPADISVSYLSVKNFRVSSPGLVLARRLWRVSADGRVHDPEFRRPIGVHACHPRLGLVTADRSPLSGRSLAVGRGRLSVDHSRASPRRIIWRGRRGTDVEPRRLDDVAIARVMVCSPSGAGRPRSRATSSRSEAFSKRSARPSPSPCASLGRRSDHRARQGQAPRTSEG